MGCLELPRNGHFGWAAKGPSCEGSRPSETEIGKGFEELWEGDLCDERAGHSRAAAEMWTRSEGKTWASIALDIEGLWGFEIGFVMAR